MKIVKSCFVVIQQDDKCLLIQEGGGGNRGLWSLPGGHVDEGETLDAAAVRECAEEAGVGVELIKKLDPRILTPSEYSGISTNSEKVHEVHIFYAKYLTGVPTPGIEELAVRWVDVNEINKLPLRFKFINELL